MSMVPMLDHFREAAVVAFTSREPPASQIVRYYGQPVFRYSREEILAITASLT
jgi:hypothetical protein